MHQKIEAKPPLILSPPPRVLEFFLLTGIWRALPPFMALITDQPQEAEDERER